MKTNALRHLCFGAAIAALALTAPVSSAQTLNDGLIFYAPFSSSLDDVAGGRVGQILSPPTLHPSGGVGNGGYVQLQNDVFADEQVVWYEDPTPATTDFSFQIWVRAGDAYSVWNLQKDVDFAFAANKDWGAGPNVGWVLARQDGDDDGDKFQWNLNTVGGTRKDLDLRAAPSVVFDGDWHQILVTYQRDGQARFYRDGVAIAAVDISANTGSLRPTLGTWVTNNILALGQDATLRFYHATDPYNVSSYNGDLDEAAMWDRVLTPEEAAAAYLKGKNGVNWNSAQALVFVQQPVGGTRYASDTFPLSCTVASDRGPVSYQWYKDGNPIANATNRTLLLTDLTAGQANYTVVARDPVGSVTSTPATVRVLSTANITEALAVYLNFDDNIDAQGSATIYPNPTGNDPNPKYAAGRVGQAADFNNDASGSGIPTDWVLSLGDIEWIYTNNWTFSLWVNMDNNLWGGLLGNKNWSSGENLGWVFSPHNNDLVNYKAKGGPRRDFGGVNVRDGVWHHVVGVFNRDLNMVYVYVDGNLSSSASLGQTGWETLTPDNLYPNDTLVGGSGNGPYAGKGRIDDLGLWTRTLTPGEIFAIYEQGTAGKPLTTAVAVTSPNITSHPRGRTVYEGQQVTLTGTAVGSAPLAYQWFRDGNAVAGATTAALQFVPITLDDSGDYTLVVTNRFGAVTSEVATVTVRAITDITSGLTVYLNLDDNLQGAAGTTHSGTPIGNQPTPKYVDGQIGRAASFDNDSTDGPPSDWAVSLGNIESLYAGSWSCSLWVRATKGNDGALIGNKDWNDGSNIGWVFVPTRVRAFNFRAEGGPTRMDIGTVNTLDGQWHHVVATFDREINRVHYYVDGFLNYSTNLAVTGMESLTPANFPNDTLIGGSGNGRWSGAGFVDDVGLWERPLSGQEVMAIYTQGLQREPLTTAGPQAYVPLILAPPPSRTCVAGVRSVFTVGAVGSPPLTYQWYRNGVSLAGQTQANLEWLTTPADAGAEFTVVVGNAYGSVTSTPPAILTVTPAPAAVTNGLVVYLNFDNNIQGQAGTTVHGTAIGNVGQEKYTTGVVGSAAAQFDNEPINEPIVTDWAISLGDIEWLYAGSFSFALWVKTTDTYGTLLGNKSWLSGTNVGWCISQYRNPNWLNYRTEGVLRRDIGNSPWADDQWHHVAAVFHREGNRVFTYVDGNLTAHHSIGNTGYEGLTPTDIMTTLVGSSGDTHDSSFGSVDDLGMWARPLGEAEVLAIYQAGQQGKPLTEAQVALGPPTLGITADADAITLIFPVWAADYTLESSASLTGTWTEVTAARSEVDEQIHVTVPRGPGAQFFRLVR